MLASHQDRSTVVHIVRIPYGGIRKHIVAILEAIEKDHDLDWMLITDLSGSDAQFESFLKENPKRLSKILNLSISDQPQLADLKNLFTIFRALKQLKAARLVHGHGAKGGLYARAVAQLLRRSSLYTPHGGSLHDVFSPLKKWLFIAVEWSLSFLTDLFVFESNYSKQQFFKLVRSPNPNKVLINYNGVSVSDLRTAAAAPPQALSLASPSTYKIASFGMLRHLKGHDIAIKAISLLKQDHIQYHIFGDGEEAKNLKELIAQLKLERQVLLHQNVANIYPDMRQADLVIHPSRFESFGYVPIEAMALQVPCIAAKTGGLIEIIKDQETGLFFEPENAEDLARKILLLIEHPELAQRLKANAAQFLKSNFQESHMTASILGVYKRLLG